MENEAFTLAQYKAPPSSPIKYENPYHCDPQIGEEVLSELYSKAKKKGKKTETIKLRRELVIKLSDKYLWPLERIGKFLRISKNVVQQDKTRVKKPQETKFLPKIN